MVNSCFIKTKKIRITVAKSIFSPNKKFFY
jgi:hypothetical protein